MAPHTRTSTTRIPGEAINEDRLCRKCNYSLKGLSAGGLCPECGTPIPSSKPRVLGGDNLSDAPVQYLRKLGLGLAVASIGMCLIVAGLLYLRGTADTPGPIMLAGGVLFWIAGVALAAGKRPRSESTLGDAALDHAPWLLGIRLLQLIWLFPALFAAWRYLIIQGGSTNGLDLALNGLNISAVIAFIATVPVLAHLNALATWAGDESLAARIHTSAWGIAVCGILGPGLFLGSPWLGPVKLPATVIGAIFLVLLGLCLVIAVISVIQIASISLLAISSNAAAEARDARIAQKRAREAQEAHERQMEVEARLASLPDTPAPKTMPKSPAPTENKPTYRTGGHRIEDAGDASDIYELAPEDPE